MASFFLLAQLSMVRRPQQNSQSSRLRVQVFGALNSSPKPLALNPKPQTLNPKPSRMIRVAGCRATGCKFEVAEAGSVTFAVSSKPVRLLHVFGFRV